MEIFRQLIAALSGTPAWVPLLLVPALTVLSALLFTLLGGRRAYPYPATALGAAGSVLLCCILLQQEGAAQALAGMFVYAGLYAALASLLRLLFFLPRPRRSSKRTPRDERIYERFRGEPLTSAMPRAAQPSPEKVCCYEEAPALSEPPELSHALSLLEKLRKEKLTASDRLEADVLARSVGALKGRALNDEEKGTLNDCLASVLKLTAKYKL